MPELAAIPEGLKPVFLVALNGTAKAVPSRTPMLRPTNATAEGVPPDTNVEANEGYQKAIAERVLRLDVTSIPAAW